MHSDCNSLTFLSLANNNMLSLGKWTVKNILSLRHLDLSGNRFRDLGGLQFEGKNLETINLDNNKVIFQPVSGVRPNNLSSVRQIAEHNISQPQKREKIFRCTQPYFVDTGFIHVQAARCDRNQPEL